jgi:hypothetical protein
MFHFGYSQYYLSFNNWLQFTKSKLENNLNSKMKRLIFLNYSFFNPDNLIFNKILNSLFYSLVGLKIEFSYIK